MVTWCGMVGQGLLILKWEIVQAKEKGPSQWRLLRFWISFLEYLVARREKRSGPGSIFNDKTKFEQSYIKRKLLNYKNKLLIFDFVSFHVTFTSFLTIATSKEDMRAYVVFTSVGDAADNWWKFPPLAPMVSNFLADNRLGTIWRGMVSVDLDNKGIQRNILLWIIFAPVGLR